MAALCPCGHLQWWLGIFRSEIRYTSLLFINVVIDKAYKLVQNLQQNLQQLSINRRFLKGWRLNVLEEKSFYATILIRLTWCHLCHLKQLIVEKKRNICVQICHYKMISKTCLPFKKIIFFLYLIWISHPGSPTW